MPSSSNDEVAVPPPEEQDADDPAEPPPPKAPVSALEFAHKLRSEDGVINLLDVDLASLKAEGWEDVLKPDDPDAPLRLLEPPAAPSEEGGDRSGEERGAGGSHSGSEGSSLAPVFVAKAKPKIQTYSLEALNEEDKEEFVLPLKDDLTTEYFMDVGGEASSLSPGHDRGDVLVLRGHHRGEQQESSPKTTSAEQH